MNDDPWVYGWGKKQYSYEDFFKDNITKIIEYPWIREYYDRPLVELRKLVKSSDKKSKTYRRLNPVLSSIKHANIDTLFPLLDAIATEDKARQFLKKYHLTREEIDNFIFYVRSYALPKKSQLREYIFTDDPKESGYLKILKKHKMANNLVLTETCRTKKGRMEISEKTGVPEEILLDFVNRFSVGRAPFLGGKSVKHMWRAGYRNLKDARTDTPENMTKRLVAAFASVGLAMPHDFRKGCEEGAMIQVWKNMPEIIEY